MIWKGASALNEEEGKEKKEGERDIALSPRPFGS